MRAAFASDPDLTLRGSCSSCSSTTARAPARSACRWDWSATYPMSSVSRVRGGFRDRTLDALGGPTVDDPNCRVIRDGS